jgi:hypothetical protein
MKRASLAANVKAAAAAPTAQAPLPERMSPPERATRPAGGRRAASREGRKALYAWVDPAEHLKLKRLSLETGRSIDALVAEGVGLVLARNGIS